jgi:hypothetical protein
MTHGNENLAKGGAIMSVGALIFLAYAVVYFLRSFAGAGFEIGVPTLNGVTPADLDGLNPAIMAFIIHSNLALAGFIAATSIAVIALCWYGVRAGLLWAWLTAMVAPVVALVVALPKHYFGGFDHNWITHIGPIYLGTAIFVAGGLIALTGLLKAMNNRVSPA